MEKIFQVYGAIIKKEVLSSIDKNLCNRFFVLYTDNPYPGYYSQIIPDSNSFLPRSLFFITKGKIENEIIFRLSKQLKLKKNIDVDITPAEIEVQNILRNAIRIKNIDNFSQIKEIATFITESDIRFEKSKNIDEYIGLIKIKKMFEVKEVNNGEWIDTRDNGMAYFKIPRKISWEKFEKITKLIKNNVKNNIFDAALGYFFVNFDIEDIIRIYDPNIDKEKINNIRELYLKEIDK